MVVTIGIINESGENSPCSPLDVTGAIAGQSNTVIVAYMLANWLVFGNGIFPNGQIFRGMVGPHWRRGDCKYLRYCVGAAILMLKLFGVCIALW